VEEGLAFFERMLAIEPGDAAAVAGRRLLAHLIGQTERRRRRAAEQEQRDELTSSVAASSAGTAPAGPPRDEAPAPRLAAEQPTPELAALLEQALAHADQDRPAECEAAFRRMLEIEPDNVRALMELGVLAMGAPDAKKTNAWVARVREGITFFERMLAIEPGNTAAVQGRHLLRHLIWGEDASIAAAPAATTSAADPAAGCASCGAVPAKALRCGRCKAVAYCDRALLAAGGNVPFTPPCFVFYGEYEWNVRGLMVMTRYGHRPRLGLPEAALEGAQARVPVTRGGGGGGGHPQWWRSPGHPRWRGGGGGRRRRCAPIGLEVHLAVGPWDLGHQAGRRRSGHRPRA
jgi:hypothetical protein